MHDYSTLLRQVAERLDVPEDELRATLNACSLQLVPWGDAGPQRRQLGVRPPLLVNEAVVAGS